MKKMNLVLLATALLLTPALTSCTKEEMKQAPNTDTKSTEVKSLARNNNYVMYGVYKNDGWFTGCVGSNGCCMVVVRPVIGWTTPDSYTVRPDIDAGDDKLQVDIYKAAGIETNYYSQMDVTIEQNGDQSVEFTQ
jgi:hypothetical protein